MCIINNSIKDGFILNIWNKVVNDLVLYAGIYFNAKLKYILNKDS